MSQTTGLLTLVTSWLESNAAVKFAVLFGSSARNFEESTAADRWSDLDLHIVTSDAAGLEKLDWASVFPGLTFCLQVARPATGGVRKLTILFTSGQLDLVLIPVSQLHVARLAMWLGLHKRKGRLKAALDEIHTSIYLGYRSLKNDKKWALFYSRIMAEMAGVRLTNSEARGLADVFLCEMLWVLQKIERGELAAAQRALHRTLAETNFRLLRELRLRRGDSLPSFGLARRVESLLPKEELNWITVDARLDRAELSNSTWRLHSGLREIVRQLDPEWRTTDAMSKLLGTYATNKG